VCAGVGRRAVGGDGEVGDTGAGLEMVITSRETDSCHSLGRQAFITTRLPCALQVVVATQRQPRPQNAIATNASLPPSAKKSQFGPLPLRSPTARGIRVALRLLVAR
jgi:hypothetical protein